MPTSAWGIALGYNFNGISTNGAMTHGARASAGQVESVLLLDGQEIVLR